MLKNPRLRVINSALSGQEFPLPEHPVIVGRSSGCDVVIADQSISRQHVRAEVKDGQCLLKDLGSHNGIYIGGASTRSAALSPGERFELGDIAIEFRAEHTTQAVSADEPLDHTAQMPVPAGKEQGMVPPEGYELAVPGAQLPGERAVSVDEIFGGAPKPSPVGGPGEEEKAAVEGARGTLGYILAIILVITLGVISWNMVGDQAAEEDVKQVNIRVGEKIVIDLGLRFRQYKGRIVNYIDEREVYSNFQYVNPDGAQIASFEIDRTQFMATVEGISFGWTDIRLLGPRGREAIVRVVVQGEMPTPPAQARMSDAERLSKGRLLYQSGKAAMESGSKNGLFRAIQRLTEADAVLRALTYGEGVQVRTDAGKLLRDARKKFDDEFERIKQQALSRMNSGDYRGAAKEWEILREMIPDEKDEMHQKLKIIFDRAIRKMKQG